MRGLVLAVVARSQTAAMILKKLGSEHGFAMLSDATDVVVARFGDEWGGLLMAAYRETLTADEMKAVAAAVQARDRDAMVPIMERVRPVMKQKVEPLLLRASTEALRDAYEQMMREPAQ